MKNYTDEIFQSIETNLNRFEKENKNDTEILKNSVDGLKQSFEVSKLK
jgi:hypothetical protein